MHWRTLRILTIGALLCGMVVAAPLSAPAGAATTQIDDINPDSSDLADPNGASGGRVNMVASSAGNDDVFFAATEYGGLYKTTNGGARWSLLKGHLPMVTWDVETDPANSGIVYATSFFDGKEDPKSGLARSGDGGVTWTHNIARPADGFCNANRRDEPWAFGIDIRNDNPNVVVVGTNCGLAISTNRGATWTFRDPSPTNGALPADVWDVVVQPGTAGLSIIDTCGDDGHRRSLDGGTTWNAAGTGQPTGGRCSLGVSPDESGVLLMTASDNSYYESDDGGATWNSLGNVVRSNGRVPFVAINDRAGAAFDIWGGGASLYRGGCTTPVVPDPTVRRCPAANTWAGGFSAGGIGDQTGAHDDVGDVAFDIDDGCPRIFSSDGGVHTRNTPAGGDCHTPDGSVANGGWARANVGLHAMWLFAMAGADRAGAEAEDLYLGLQDNGSWATTNAGAPSPTWNNRDCCDIFDIVADGDRVLYTMCCFGGGGPGTRLFIRQPGMTGGGEISVASRPPGNFIGFRPTPTLAKVSGTSYVVVTTAGVYLTEDVTANPIVWNALGTAPTNACSIQTGAHSGAPDSRAFYVQAGTCNERNMGNTSDQLFKYTGTATNGTWDRIDDNIVGGAGVGIFGADTKNPNRLYASDIRQEANGGPRMVFSQDGGQTWEQDGDLDLLMTGNGAFEYMTEHGPPNFPHDSDITNKPRGYPQPTFVAFDPDDPDLIAAGGRDSGVFLSTNGGDTWGLLTDPLNSDTSSVPHLPRPWFGYFDHVAGDVDLYVGTQGRGVWRLDLTAADVSITKTDTRDPVNAGEKLIYSLTVTNNGPDTAEEVVIRDNLPAEATFLTSAPNICTETATDVLTCAVGDLANGASAIVDIEVLIDADAVANEPDGEKGITNTATVTTGGSIDDNEANDTATASTIVNDLTDLRVTKVSDPSDQVNAGETFRFRVFVDNLGPSVARDVVLTDTLLSSSSDFTMGTPTTSHGTCTAPTAAGSFSCNLGRLGLFPVDRAVIEVQVTSREGGVFEDQAVATSATPESNSANNRATDTIAVTAIADLSLTKTDDPDPVVAGETLTYQVTATNAAGSSTAKNVVINDDLPAEVSLVSVSGGPGSTGCNAGTPGDPTNPTRCAYGTVDAGASRTMTIVVRVAPDAYLGDGLIENDAFVTSETVDDDNSDNFVTEPTQVVGRADLGVTKSDSPDPVQAGRQLTYELRVTNAGPSVAQGVKLVDTLPRGDATAREVDFQSATIANGSGSCVVSEVPPPSVEKEPGQRVDCELNTIRPNPPQPVVVTISVMVRQGTQDGTVLVNRATVGSSTTDPNAANNQAVQETTVVGIADLAIAITSDADVYKPSSTVKYTISVTDHGPSQARNVVVTQQLPDTKQAVYNYDTQGCTKTGLTLTCQLGTVRAGTTKSFNVYVTVKGRKGRVDTSASVTSTNPDPVTSNNSASRQVLIQSI